MARNRVTCEIDPANQRVIRIFRHPAKAIFMSPDVIRELPRKDAVEDVRRQVFERAGGVCEHCPKILTFETMHMHEKIFRSHGGEQSLANCQCLCADCHLIGEHGGLQWSKQ